MVFCEFSIRCCFDIKALSMDPLLTSSVPSKIWASAKLPKLIGEEKQIHFIGEFKQSLKNGSSLKLRPIFVRIQAISKTLQKKKGCCSKFAFFCIFSAIKSLPKSGAVT